MEKRDGKMGLRGVGKCEIMEVQQLSVFLENEQGFLRFVGINKWRR